MSVLQIRDPITNEFVPIAALQGELYDGSVTEDKLADGSVTYAKLNGSVTKKLFMMTPDDFEGTDTEKLQAAFNYFSQRGSGVICINRAYNIEDDILIAHQTFYGINNRITVIGLSPSATIDMNENSFAGANTDVRNYGGVTFQNIDFTGSGALFRCDNLIRISLDNCSIRDFAYVMYSDQTIQTMYIHNCLLRDISNKIIEIPESETMYWATDCKLTNNVMERCNQIVDIQNVSTLDILNNCIEAFHDCPIRINKSASLMNICDNYFESNNNGYNTGDTDGLGVTIDLTGMSLLNSVNIERNSFAYRIGDTIILLPSNPTNTGYTHGYINIVGNHGGSSGRYLICASPDRVLPYYNVNIEGNLGGIKDDNNLLFPNDRKITTAITGDYGSFNVIRRGGIVEINVQAVDVIISGATPGWVTIGTLPTPLRSNLVVNGIAWDTVHSCAMRAQLTRSGVLQVQTTTASAQVALTMTYLAIGN